MIGWYYFALVANASTENTQVITSWSSWLPLALALTHWMLLLPHMPCESFPRLRDALFPALQEVGSGWQRVSDISPAQPPINIGTVLAILESILVSISLCTVSMVESVSVSILSALKSLLSVSSSRHTAASFYECITIHQWLLCCQGVWLPTTNHDYLHTYLFNKVGESSVGHCGAIVGTGTPA